MSRDAVEAERSLLGGVLSSAGALPVAAAALRPEDFHRPEHAALFRLFLDMAVHGEAIDIVTVHPHLFRLGPDRFGGAGYVVSLPEHCPSTANLGHYVGTIRRAATHRRALAAATTVLRVLQGEEAPPDDVDHRDPDALVQWAAGQLACARRPDVPGRGRRAGQDLINELLGAEERGDPPSPTFPTGFADLDDMLGGGLWPGQLVVVGGAPSMGKSSLAMALLIATAEAGASAHYYSLEPDAKDWTRRFLSGVGQIRHEGLVDRSKRAQSEYDMLYGPDNVSDIVRDWRFSFEHRPGSGLQDVVASARELKASRQGLDVLFIDYLQLLRTEDVGGRHDLAIARITTPLRDLAGQLGIAVVLLSQLNREGQKSARVKTDVVGPWWQRCRLPTTFDLRDASSIESDADVLLFPYRADIGGSDRTAVDGTMPGDAVISVAKNRNGRCGVVRCVWDGPTVLYRDIDPNGPI